MARFLVVIIISVMLAGCVLGGQVMEGSGRTVTKDYDFEGFTRLAVGNAFRVEVTQGESYSVSVTVDDNLEEYLDVQQAGDEVRIYMKPRAMLTLRNVSLDAQITMPALQGLDLSGATRTTVRGFGSEDDLDVEVSGASRLTGDITAGAAKIEASGASTVELDGSAGKIRANASGASTLRLDEFSVRDADVDASGASRISVDASGQIRGSASGASTVEYLGNPASVKVETSGASSVRSK